MSLATPLGDLIVQITMDQNKMSRPVTLFSSIFSNTRENRSSNSATYGHNSPGTDSSAEFNRLSGEPNLRISREMDEVMNSVSVQNQRAKNDAISKPSFASNSECPKGQFRTIDTERM